MVEAPEGTDQGEARGGVRHCDQLEDTVRLIPPVVHRHKRRPRRRWEKKLRRGYVRFCVPAWCEWRRRRRRREEEESVEYDAVDERRKERG